MSTRAPRKKKPTSTKARPKAKPRAKPAPEPAAEPSRPAEAAEEQARPEEPALEETLQKLGAEVKRWTNKGRYTKVRFKFRGRQLLPDLPLAAVVAAQGLSFYWAGILRVLLVNVAGGSLIDVELVNDADKKVQEGREAVLSGDLDRALEHFRRALEMDPDNASAHLNEGIALKLKGQRAEARAALEQARKLDPKGATGAEAERVLTTLEPGMRPPGE
ncbi:MAG: tetratricopeptide repeat protein [Myxococcaceae bacterium]